jgi:hypothetical protein
MGGGVTPLKTDLSTVLLKALFIEFSLLGFAFFFVF